MNAPSSAAPHCRWKRPFDLALILLALPIWGLVMLAVGLWIKMVSPGPVIFRQERVGFRQKRFTMFKFRSMKVSAATAPHESHFTHLIQSDAPMTKLDVKGDNRVIAGGAFFRAAGLDELPQIFNILRGEMSLVGPRPCTPYELQHYGVDHLVRVEVPPGLTGYWQVNGKNGTTFQQMIRMDTFYARHASLALDLKILFKTGAVLLAQLVNAALPVSRSLAARDPDQRSQIA